VLNWWSVFVIKNTSSPWCRYTAVPALKFGTELRRKKNNLEQSIKNIISITEISKVNHTQFSWLMSMDKAHRYLLTAEKRVKVLLTENWIKMSTNPLFTSPVADKKGWGHATGWVNAVCFLQSFYTIGWVAGTAAGPEKPVPKVLFWNKWTKKSDSGTG